MNISALKQSRFLTKDDFGAGKLVTIKGDLKFENVARSDEAEEIKPVIFFEEFEKGFVLNNTNPELIASIVGSKETSNWNGHKIVGYHDPTIMHRGKVTGGTRFRAPKSRAPQPAPQIIHPAPAAPQPSPGAETDEVPF